MRPTARPGPRAVVGAASVTCGASASLSDILRRRAVLVPAAIVAVAIAAAGCGGGDRDETSVKPAGACRQSWRSPNAAMLPPSIDAAHGVARLPDEPRLQQRWTDLTILSRSAASRRALMSASKATRCGGRMDLDRSYPLTQARLPAGSDADQSRRKKDMRRSTGPSSAGDDVRARPGGSRPGRDDPRAGRHDSIEGERGIHRLLDGSV